MSSTLNFQVFVIYPYMFTPFLGVSRWKMKLEILARSSRSTEIGARSYWTRRSLRLPGLVNVRLTKAWLKQPSPRERSHFKGKRRDGDENRLQNSIPKHQVKIKEEIKSDIYPKVSQTSTNCRSSVCAWTLGLTVLWGLSLHTYLLPILWSRMMPM